MDERQGCHTGMCIFNSFSRSAWCQENTYMDVESRAMPGAIIEDAQDAYMDNVPYKRCPSVCRW